MSFLERRGGWKIAAVLGAALTIAACAKNPAEDPNALANANSTAATPGSPQDFAVNVGDRVFFDSDFKRIEFNRPGDARQAGALAHAICAIQFHHRGPCRRARHARI